MRLTDPRLDAALCAWRANPDPEQRAEADNLWFEERVSAARQAAFEGQAAGADDADRLRRGHADYWAKFVRTDPDDPHTFLAGFGPAGPGLLDPHQWIVRLESLDRPLRAWEPQGDWAERFAKLAAARDAGNAAAVEKFVEEWNLNRDHRPAFAAFADQLEDELLEPDWPRRLRDRLDNPDQPSDAPWLAGLGQWALARQPSEEAFGAEWLALKPLYPRPPERWRQLVAALLAGPTFRDATIKYPGWWGADETFPPLRPPSASRSPFGSAPTPKETNSVLAELDQPFAQVEPRIHDLMARHRRFRDRFGECQFFIRAATGLGQALLRRSGDAAVLRQRLAATLAREGLDWEPGDKALRTVWRDALEALGMLVEAELVGWDFVRREPDDPEPRNQLARLLADKLNRLPEAESLLRDTAERFPADPCTRAQLAGLLLDTRRCDEAQGVLSAAFDAGAVAPASYAVMIRLLMIQGREPEARHVVSKGLERFPADEGLKHFRQLLGSGTIARTGVSEHRGLAPVPALAWPARFPDAVPHLGPFSEPVHLFEGLDAVATPRPFGFADEQAPLGEFGRPHPTRA